MEAVARVQVIFDGLIARNALVSHSSCISFFILKIFQLIRQRIFNVLVYVLCQNNKNKQTNKQKLKLQLNKSILLKSV